MNYFKNIIVKKKLKLNNNILINLIYRYYIFDLLFNVLYLIY